MPRGARVTAYTAPHKVGDQHCDLTAEPLLFPCVVCAASPNSTDPPSLPPGFKRIRLDPERTEEAIEDGAHLLVSGALLFRKRLGGGHGAPCPRLACAAAPRQAGGEAPNILYYLR